MRRKRTRRALGATVVAMLVLVGFASVAGASAPTKFQLTVTDDFSSGSINFVVSPTLSTLTSGTYKLGLANNSIGPHVFVAIGGLPEGITVDGFVDVIEAVEGGAAPPAGTFEAGAVFSKPGQDHQKLFDLTTAGQYGYFCPIRTPAGVPHYQLGFVGLFDVASA